MYMSFLTKRPKTCETERELLFHKSLIKVSVCVLCVYCFVCVLIFFCAWAGMRGRSKLDTFLNKSKCYTTSWTRLVAYTYMRFIGKNCSSEQQLHVENTNTEINLEICHVAGLIKVYIQIQRPYSFKKETRLF